jgi:hypothetical protein
LVALLPEEHVFAHRLLCRMHPGHAGLAYAVVQLCGKLQGREARRVYAADRRRHSAALTGRVLSQETKARMSAAKLGNKGRAGQVHTPETLAKMSAVKKGKPKSAEHRARLSAVNMGRVYVAAHTAETKAKMSAARKGRPMSDEHKAKLRAAGLAQQARRRGSIQDILIPANLEAS